MSLKTVVREAAKNKGVKGVMSMSLLCDLSYERTVRVWNGSLEAKFKDVITVLNALDIDIDYINKTDLK